MRCGAEGSGTSAITVKGPLGWVRAVMREGKVVGVCLPQETREQARNHRMSACPAGCEGEGGEEGLGELAADLRRYFAGERVDLGRHAVDVSGRGEFERRALEAAQRIPYGEVRSYGWVAARAGSARGARAAGRAMSRNPVPLVVPCHRVVGAGGRLTGFGGGLEMKRALLALEGVACEGMRVRQGRGVT